MLVSDHYLPKSMHDIKAMSVFRLQLLANLKQLRSGNGATGPRTVAFHGHPHENVPTPQH